MSTLSPCYAMKKVGDVFWIDLFELIY